jgi:7-cyano-7-deazaguanine reductase
MSKYTKKHAVSGVGAKLPEIECIPNNHKGYEITIDVPEYS